MPRTMLELYRKPLYSAVFHFLVSFRFRSTLKKRAEERKLEMKGRLRALYVRSGALLESLSMPENIEAAVAEERKRNVC